MCVWAGRVKSHLEQVPALLCPESQSAAFGAGQPGHPHDKAVGSSISSETCLSLVTPDLFMKSDAFGHTSSQLSAPVIDFRSCRCQNGGRRNKYATPWRKPLAANKSPTSPKTPRTEN